MSVQSSRCILVCARTVSKMCNMKIVYTHHLVKVLPQDTILYNSKLMLGLRPKRVPSLAGASDVLVQRSVHFNGQDAILSI